ncbi:MAG TPA: SpoIIE family protein phosphatase [Candidatus Acidoferrales bacterium]|nr:SpoIIE family protein phosphatase [Candidatus Acidoferrales bacterium]
MRTLFGRGRTSKRTSSALEALRGPAFTAAAVLAIALFVSVIGSAVTYVRVDQAYKQQNAIDMAKSKLDDLFQEQLDEETATRGYIATGRKTFLEPYTSALPAMEQDLDLLQADLEQAKLTNAYPLVFDLRHAHDLWESQVGRPLVANPTSPEAAALLLQGKKIMDRFRNDFKELTGLLNDQSLVAQDAVRSLLLRAALLTASLILLFGAAAIVADVIRSRTEASLERERIVGDTLQRAFLSGWDSCPFLEVGTAYVSAARHLAIGGDLFDVQLIDDHRCLLVVADVSGKGLDAAVDTAFVKYSLRSLVSEYDDPNIILRKFNMAFIRSVRDDTSFVSLFAGVLDASAHTLHYASAGHSPVYVRRGDAVRQLSVTGPLVGLRLEDDFGADTAQIEPGDIIVLSTDGLTEARDTAGMMIDDVGAMRMIREAPAQPQKMADFIVAAVTRASGGRIADDLALLVVAFGKSEAAQTQAPQGLATAAAG